MSGAPDPNSLTDSKFILDSRRVWGGIMLAVPLIIQLTGINVTADQTAQIQAAVQHAQTGITSLVAAFGALQLFYGAWKAQNPLHVFTPYQVDDAGRKIAPPKPLALTPDVAKKMDENPILTGASA